jgi:hypothetical protein
MTSHKMTARDLYSLAPHHWGRIQVFVFHPSAWATVYRVIEKGDMILVSYDGFQGEYLPDSELLVRHPDLPNSLDWMD